MKRPGVVLAVLAWLGVVVVAATLVWLVISRAGQGVVTTAEPLVNADAASSAGATPTSAGTGDGTRPSTSGPRPGASESPSADPSSPAGPTPSPTTEPSSPADPPSSARRSWFGSAGVVSVECTGTSIRLAGAQPNSGHSIEVDDSGPDRVRVEFESGGEDERRTRVESFCSGGKPRFEVDAD